MPNVSPAEPPVGGGWLSSRNERLHPAGGRSRKRPPTAPRGRGFTPL